MESDREGKCKNNQDIGNTWLFEEEQQSAKEESLKVRLKWSGIAEVAELYICRALHYGNAVDTCSYSLICNTNNTDDSRTKTVKLHVVYELKKAEMPLV